MPCGASPSMSSSPPAKRPHTSADAGASAEASQAEAEAEAREGGTEVRLRNMAQRESAVVIAQRLPAPPALGSVTVLDLGVCMRVCVCVCVCVSV